jgi:hypothetical protein
MQDAAPAVAGAAASRDPAVGLAAVVALRRLAESLESLQVEAAREQGWAWQRIAAELGVSKQAVHKKYGVRRRFPGERQ